MSAPSPRGGPVQGSPSGTDAPTADFVAAVSHELRQPLASIRGLTEMLLGYWGDFSDQDKTEMLREVLHEAERVGHLVDELLDFSRMGSGQLRLRWMETDLGKVVARAMSNLAVSFPDVRVTVELPPALPTIMADPFKVEQVLFNLLENSCQHGAASAVRVAVARQAERRAEVVEISVGDNGVGIAPEDLPHVTEKFFRATVAEAGGLGLGLWISRKIVEAHGGVLLATSVPGEGTTVRFTIPLRESTGAGKLAGI
jgi:signal transduction histidine kinase